MPEPLTLRDATLNDAVVIAEIYNESILAGDATMIDEPLTTANLQQTMKGMGPREGYLLLERDGYVVGWGVIKPFGEEPAYRYTCETSVFLRRSEVRKGYGSRLKQALIDRCKRYGYHHIVARIWASNTASIEYNRNFGYEMVCSQKEIGYMNGQWQDIALMQLVLDDG